MAALTTDTQIKKAIKEAQGQKRVYHTIGGYQGLRLRIRGGCIEFQHRYTHPITGKRKEMTLGQYPALRQCTWWPRRGAHPCAPAGARP